MEAIQALQLQTDAKHRRITGQVTKKCVLVPLGLGFLLVVALKFARDVGYFH